MTVVSYDPDELVSTSQIADLLNEFFNLDDDNIIEQNTPHMWWYRSRNNKDIAYPMPLADATVGRRKAPLWKQAKIVHWYGTWQDLEVPWGREVGDRIDMKGREYPSEFRRGS